MLLPGQNRHRVESRLYERQTREAGQSLAVKSTGCSRREPRFGGSQPSLTPGTGEPMLYSDFLRHQACMRHTYNQENTYTQDKRNLKIDVTIRLASHFLQRHLKNFKENTTNHLCVENN